MNEVERTCKIHGLTSFYMSNETPPRYRCKKCRTDAVQKRRNKVKELALEYKGSKCSICGYDKCKGALEFHHLSGNDKEFGISSKGYTRSWKAIREELDKCILVCSNCHREIHYI